MTPTQALAGSILIGLIIGAAYMIYMEWDNLYL
jgi:hypothetical protein